MYFLMYLIFLTVLVEVTDEFLMQGAELLEKVGGLHNFMKWKNALLTVSIISVISSRLFIQANLLIMKE